MDATKVKLLEWDGIHAPSIVGDYSVGALGGEWKAYRNERQIASGLSLTHDGALMEAKAAAQSDYESRVLSAIAPQAGDNAEEPVAWQPKYTQEVIDHFKNIGGIWDYAMTVYRTKEEAENYGHGGHEVRPLFSHPCTSTPVVSQNAEDHPDILARASQIAARVLSGWTVRPGADPQKIVDIATRQIAEALEAERRIAWTATPVVSQNAPDLEDKGLVACPCTMIEQDEDCPEGYPSMLCGICEGKGHTTQEQVTALACEMIKIASDLGEPEDPFAAAWESVSLIQSQNERFSKALEKISSPTQTTGLLWWQAEARAALSTAPESTP